MHPYALSAGGKVKKRRVKAFKRAGGGGVTCQPTAMRHSPLIADDEAEEAKVAVGRKAGTRLDRRARGAPGKYQFGGAVGAHKLTPSKHKPHVRININNINARPRRVPVPVPVPVGGMGGGMVPGIGALPGMKKGGRVRRKQIGGGLPTQANPRAVAALAARPALPVQARGTRPFQYGGAVRPAGLPAQAAPRAAAALAARPALPAGAVGVRPFQDGGAVDDDGFWDRGKAAARSAKQRSESTEHERASRDIDKAARKPSFIGRGIWPEEMQRRDYLRKPFEQKMESAGEYARGGHIAPAKMNTRMDGGAGSGEGRTRTFQIRPASPTKRLLVA